MRQAVIDKVDRLLADGVDSEAKVILLCEIRKVMEGGPVVD